MPNLPRHPGRLSVGLLVVLLLAFFGLTALLAQEETAEPTTTTAAEVAPPVERFFGWRSVNLNNNFDITRCATIAAGDINGDNRPDLICPYNYGGNETRTFVQVTGGTGLTGWSSLQSSIQPQFDLDRCLTLLPGDMNGNGLTDLVCVYDYTIDVQITYVLEAGGKDDVWFQAWTNFIYFGVDNCTTLIVGDANGDGFDDVICPYDYGGNETRTFVQFSDGVAVTGWQVQRPTRQTQFSLALCAGVLSGDVNNDGETDLICPYNYGSNRTRTFVQLSAGKAQQPFLSWTGSTLQQQFDVGLCVLLTVGDVNGDGFDDVVCVYDYGGNRTRTFVHLSSGSSFTLWTAQSDTLQSQFDVNRCTFSTGDLNADGRMDLFCNYDYGDSNTATFVQMSRESGYSLWLRATPNTGAGIFAMGQCWQGVRAGDFTGDGHDDLACAYNYPEDTTRLFIQQAELYQMNLPSVIR